jgi:hypothetical protein
MKGRKERKGGREGEGSGGKEVKRMRDIKEGRGNTDKKEKKIFLIY